MRLDRLTICAIEDGVASCDLAGIACGSGHKPRQHRSPFLQITTADRPLCSLAQSETASKGRRTEPGTRRGLPPKSSSDRTSRIAGHLGVPMKRTSLSAEI
jgi:hypothetical protein